MFLQGKMLFSCLLPAKQIAGSSLLFYWSLFKVNFRCQNLIRAIWVPPLAILLFPAQPNFSYFVRNLNEWLVYSSWHLGCLKWKGLAEVSCPAGTSQMLYSSPMTVAETMWCSNWKERLIKVSGWMVCNVTHSFIFKPSRVEEWQEIILDFMWSWQATFSDGLSPVCVGFFPSFYDLLDSVPHPKSSIF